MQRSLQLNCRKTDMLKNYTKSLKIEISKFEDLFSESLIVLKTEIMNEILFYCSEIGVKFPINF